MAVAEAAEGERERSNPVKRMRWATQRTPARKGTLKRRSIFNRYAARLQADEKKRDSAGSELDGSASAAGDDGGPGRTVYFNVPLPDSARDEEGRPLNHYPRNKIRTAKYTPLSFIPKNLWFQFQNVANVYFLAVIILDVRVHQRIYIYVTSFDVAAPPDVPP